MTDHKSKPLPEEYGLPVEPADEIPDQGRLSAKALARQRSAARGRTIQREQDLAHRRVLVMIFFKQLRPSLRAKPSSLGTAQAIVRKLEELPFERKPPITVRTIQADILFMRRNKSFGI